ncbi:hypothetical protein GUJ93_ZPchr0013g35583 [Zizania palustris]|uniref:Uncharacterized protein n=1 Tax=Zizania palustris TaxID=103762 RepID=A0A8J6BYN5_ZIZPA|nr:hypothetical protein GUJ93_ZPchr0013g35583 [Zizania palustris]
MELGSFNGRERIDACNMAVRWDRRSDGRHRRCLGANDVHDSYLVTNWSDGAVDGSLGGMGTNMACRSGMAARQRFEGHRMRLESCLSERPMGAGETIACERTPCENWQITRKE